MRCKSALAWIVIATALALPSAVIYASHIKQRHAAIAYRTYRAMIGCRQADAVQALGRLPSGMLAPTPQTVARCTGSAVGYADASDYYDDDQRDFQRALKDAGW
jgi:hypothetical protein